MAQMVQKWYRKYHFQKVSIPQSLTLTVCPISNSFVSDGSKSEAILSVLENGMVNSDDPAYFPGYMTENLICVQKDVQLGKRELVQLTENAFEGTWLPRSMKDRFIEDLKNYVTKY